jgi:hypothetical protein
MGPSDCETAQESPVEKLARKQRAKRLARKEAKRRARAQRDAVHPDQEQVVTRHEPMTELREP